MIPDGNNYKETRVEPAHSRAEVEVMLEKQGVKNFAWKRDDPNNTYLMFEKKFRSMTKALYYKVQVPFVEKTQGKYKDPIYDEKRAYRFFYHIFKSLMLNEQIGMDFEMIFSSYMVIGKLPDGTPTTIMDKVGAALVDNRNPALEFVKNG